MSQARKSLPRGTMKRMRAEADRLGWPISYRSDLRHDEDALACRSSAAPFVWQLGPLGTHLVFPFPAASLPASEAATRERYVVGGKARPASEHIRNIAASMDARARWYIYDGLEFWSASIDDAAEFCDECETAAPSVVADWSVAS